MTWTLILILFHQASDAPSSLSVPGFKTESACKAAVEKIEPDLQRIKLYAKGWCVPTEVFGT